ncbi:hypothetical protein [Clostridium tyrobutyricum]|jgi:hypothetical protein|uniref:hypothetical protein n=1 Tax=Clostridium tyrobutyricum TaxID=1519 RepID=UPI001C38C5AD|nr:hypothetical protein [Clostridium tyrobutyricum]MBV4429542.1 hypothetical protein [Clostridium tyrobutyricum]MBV4444763.1 hypothetical protein [Clostridium tyrobutyricum]MCH4198718.1 hypothetical protein [Clostridium tyrobutyricum]MCH4259993.1 hypothetical protein [Clostridium tyrobutyricum]MCI1239667.1 hypothetical protein [Clostridium tyrobutyricum]
MNEEDMNFKDFIKSLGWSKNKFYDNIKRMCSKEVYDIDINNFRKAGKAKLDYKKDDRNFCFKKEWKDIAYVLFTMFSENPFYRKNSTAESVNLNDIIEYNKKCLKVVADKLPKNFRRETQIHPVYTSTIMETGIIENISTKIKLMFDCISKLPIEKRVEMWLNLDNQINEVIIYYYLSSYIDKKDMDNSKGEEFKNQLFGEYENISLDKYMAQVLKNEMNSDFVKERDAIIKKEEDYWKALDNFAMSFDSPEEIKAVNESWEKNIGEENYKKMQEERLENEVKIRLKYAHDVVNMNTSIDSTIDKHIESIKNEEQNETNKEFIKRLKELREMNKDDKFKNISDRILCELNYGIINRQE